MQSVRSIIHAVCYYDDMINFQISINQRYVQNSIYDNFAFAYNRSTIFLKSAKFEFSQNYLVNPFNVYEMVTFNRTKSVLTILQIVRFLLHEFLHKYM